MYSQNALATNEFLGKSWKHILPGSTEPLGVTVLKSRGVFTEAKVVLDGFWKWEQKQGQNANAAIESNNRGMVLPFTPLSLHLIISILVDMPQHGLGCPSEVDINKRKMFIEEVMELVELTPLRGTLVGLPGRNRALVKELSILLSWFKRSLLSKHNTPSPLFHNALLAFETKLVIWRTPPFSATRFFFTLVVALFGTIFWDLGGKREYLCGGGGTTGHALFHMDTLWIGNLLQFGDLEEKD
ncbi:hypothetical protein HPP92_019960 [Vanilla planifolia]|uniref:Uncharacterized protein n=1 Tax=Vanilla planifolia TaxID=51239 RepID=A0A835Q493_VANPL|nr:hypothetical protein HPP92_019960 [Vanilla planifolia]